MYIIYVSYIIRSNRILYTFCILYGKYKLYVTYITSPILYEMYIIYVLYIIWKV